MWCFRHVGGIKWGRKYPMFLKHGLWWRWWCRVADVSWWWRQRSQWRVLLFVCRSHRYEDDFTSDSSRFFKEITKSEMRACIDSKKDGYDIRKGFFHIVRLLELHGASMSDRRSEAGNRGMSGRTNRDLRLASPLSCLADWRANYFGLDWRHIFGNRNVHPINQQVRCLWCIHWWPQRVHQLSEKALHPKIQVVHLQ